MDATINEEVKDFMRSSLLWFSKAEGHIETVWCTGNKKNGFRNSLETALEILESLRINYKKGGLEYGKYCFQRIWPEQKIWGYRCA
jgi:hypothetical protein